MDFLKYLPLIDKLITIIKLITRKKRKSKDETKTDELFPFPEGLQKENWNP